MGLPTLLMWGRCKCFYTAAGCLLKELKPVTGHGAVFFSEGWRKNLCRCDSCQVCMHYFYPTTALIGCFGDQQLKCTLEKYIFTFMTYCHMPVICCGCLESSSMQEAHKIQSTGRATATSDSCHQHSVLCLLSYALTTNTVVGKLYKNRSIFLYAICSVSEVFLAFNFQVFVMCVHISAGLCFNNAKSIMGKYMSWHFLND